MDADRQVEKYVKRINDLKEALKFTLKWEGGYVNDPDDPGGETKWGISKKSYPDLDIKNLTNEQALMIYAKDYWNPLGCDNIVFPFNVAVFDTAVNCGTQRALRWLRQNPTVGGFMECRHQHYIDIINKNPSLVKYAKGWWARYGDLQKFLYINGGYSDSASGRSSNPVSPV